jgi:serine/threonine-protein kinase
LALITCEMLTGKLPFLGTTQQEIMMARLRGGPVPMRELRPDLELPPGVQLVIDKALHRSPDDRYATAPEFAAALAAAAVTFGASTAIIPLLKEMCKRLLDYLLGQAINKVLSGA